MDLLREFQDLPGARHLPLYQGGPARTASEVDVRDDSHLRVLQTKGKQLTRQDPDMGGSRHRNTNQIGLGHPTPWQLVLHRPQGKVAPTEASQVPPDGGGYLCGIFSPDLQHPPQPQKDERRHCH